MRKLNFLVMTFMLLAISNSFGQSKDIDAGPTCTTCNDPKDRIQNNGDGTFTADAAQAYYWKICSGTATISGSNTSQTITVSGTVGSTSRIMLTRFANGICYEACEEFTMVNSCDFDLELTGKLFCNGPSGSGTGNIKIDKSPSYLANVAQVWYSLDINENNYPGFEFDATGTSQIYVQGNPLNGFNATFSFDSNCQTISTFVFDVLVEFNDGCIDHFENNFPVVLSTFTPSPLNMYPNPASNGDSVSFDGMEYKEIQKIEIFDLVGVSKSSIQPTEKSFDVSGLTPGIYIVQFTSVTNEVVQKKLVIE